MILQRFQILILRFVYIIIPVKTVKFKGKHFHTENSSSLRISASSEPQQTVHTLQLESHRLNKPALIAEAICRVEDFLR